MPTCAPYPWQQQHWQSLTKRSRDQRLPHGLLLHGPAGTGKNAFAARFAQALLCREPLPDGTPCNVCQACLLVQAGTHPDLLRVSPEEDSKVVRVDQIRSLNAKLSGKSQFGGYRVALLTPAERMNTEAANSLLKTLEEPGADTVLLLVSAQPARLPATVRSRCQQLAFPVPDPDMAQAWLQQRCPEEGPPALLALANGAPLAALEVAEEGAQAQREDLFVDLEALLTADRDPVALAGKWQGLDLGRGLDWIGAWISDMIRLQAADAPPHVSSRDRLPALTAMARRVPARLLFQQLDRVGEARRLMHTAVSPQAILEHVLIPLKNAGAGR